MRHAELRQRLRAYADGTLADSEAELVRAHLGTGCADCLRDLFARPVGLPRPPVVVRRVRGPVVAAIAAGAAALGLGAGALVATARAPRVDGSASIERLTSEVEALRTAREQADAAARTRLEQLEARLREALAREPSAAPPPSVPSPAVERPSPETVPQWLAELLASRGARTIPLAATGAAPGATGYAVWSPMRGLVVLAASGLPSGPDATLYRVRIATSDDAVAWAGDFTASPDGTLLVTVTVPVVDRRRMTVVELYRDPPGTVVLAGRDPR